MICNLVDVEHGPIADLLDRRPRPHQNLRCRRPCKFTTVHLIDQFSFLCPSHFEPPPIPPTLLVMHLCQRHT